MSVTDIRIDPDRLVDWASQAIGVPSFTGSEEAMAELMRDTFVDLGLQVQWQQVEDGRANGVGAVGHGGGAPGMNGELRIYPKSGYVVAVLSNLDPPAASQVAGFLDLRLPK